MATKRVSTGYRPRKLQAELHRSLKRFSVLVAHRRFGKTVFCVNELLDQALRCDRERPRYGYIAPFYRQAKQVAWDYVKAYAGPIPGASFNEGELRCDLPNGARITLYGADNPDSLRGIYLDGVVLDEFAQMNNRVWSEIIRPALADRQGWAVFIGTPMGRNAFYQVYDFAQQRQAAGEDWFAALHKASATGIIPTEELEAARREMADEDRYQQEFECSFDAAIQGAYYGDLLNKAEADQRIIRIPIDPHVKVDVAWDLGIGDSTSLWFVQCVGREVRIVDFYEASGVGLDHYARVLNEKGYLYGEQLLPHDVQVQELGTGKSRLETLGSMGVRNVRVVPKLSVDDGINAVRGLIPRCWFDAERCKEGIERLRQYRREYDDKMKTFKPRPLHDWTSHAADAFRYLAVGLRENKSDFGRPLVYNDNWIV